jgi:outer membrane protein assembly factor BamB
VQAYNIADGKLLWETALTGGHSAKELYVAEKRIFVSTGDNEFFMLSEQGEILEHHIMQADVYGEMNGVMYVQDNAFRAIEVASGHELWQVDVDRFGFWSSPIFDKGIIFVRTADVKGTIYSIDQSTGEINWKVSQDMYSNLFVANGKIYFISSDGYLVVIDRNSGAELSRVGFSPSGFKLKGDREDYCITGDPTNNVLAVAFGDNNQILGIKIKNP